MQCPYRNLVSRQGAGTQAAFMATAVNLRQHFLLRTWADVQRADALAGLTTSFALLPECIAFALVAHLNPLMGLYGAFIICTLTALFGGRPGMVSGAAGSMAVKRRAATDTLGTTRRRLSSVMAPTTTTVFFSLPFLRFLAMRDSETGGRLIRLMNKRRSTTLLKDESVRPGGW